MTSRVTLRSSLRGIYLNTVSSRFHIRFNHNLAMSTTIKKPSSVTVQFVGLFSVFFIGSKLLSINLGTLNSNSEQSISQYPAPYKVSSFFRGIGDVVALGIFSVLSTQKVLITQSKNTLQDALLVRPNDIQNIYKVAGGKIGARTAIYFVVAKECLRSYSYYQDFVHLPFEFSVLFPMGLIANILGTLPMAVLMPWLYGRFIGYSVIGSSHAKVISLYERSGMEAHLIGPRYTFHAMKSHPVDLMFIRNPVISRACCVFLALCALSPHVFTNTDDTQDGGRFIDKGGNNFVWEYHWSSKSTSGSGDSSGGSRSGDDDGGGGGDLDGIIDSYNNKVKSSKGNRGESINGGESRSGGSDYDVDSGSDSGRGGYDV